MPYSIAFVLLLMSPAAGPAGLPVFEERDGRVIIEVESHPPVGAWAPERNMNGYTGAGYYTWRGPNLFRSPGQAPLVYAFEIKTPGTYQLRIRNRHDFHDSTEQNDCFTRLDGGKWIKTFSSKRGEWTFRSNHEHNHHTKPNASYQLKPGRHFLQISGRSKGFSIDRIHLYCTKDRAAEDPNLPETRVAPPEPKPLAMAKNSKKPQGRAPGGEQLPNLAVRLSLAKRYSKKGDAKRVVHPTCFLAYWCLWVPSSFCF